MTDYEAVLVELGLSHAEVRAISENMQDQIPMPRAYDVEVRPSPIEGLGVFVTRPFRQGEIIAPARIGARRTPVGRYTNHAKSPNCRMLAVFPRKRLVLVAFADIAAGEEVTVDYLDARKAALYLDKVSAQQEGTSV